MVEVIDEYFIVFDYGIFGTGCKSKAYKCDQIEGVIELLKDNGVIVTSS